MLYSPICVQVCLSLSILLAQMVTNSIFTDDDKCITAKLMDG